MPIPILSDDDDDSDILNEAQKAKEAKKKDIGGIRGPNGEKLPEHLEKALEQYIDTSRADAEANTPIEFRATAEVLDHWAQSSQYQRSGAALVAICELLDEITEGALTTLSHYHEARRTIIWTSQNIRNVRFILNVFEAADRANFLGELYEFLDIYLDYLYFTRENAVETYRKLSEMCGREVDENFIDTGVISTRSYWERQVFARPPAYEDE